MGITLESFGAEESKKYYESELQKKILYIPNLSYFLNLINQQALKLPHEMQDQNINQQLGTTYADIEKSIINAIEMVWAQLAPLRRKLSSQPDRLIDLQMGRPENFTQAMEKLTMIYLLLDKADALNENLVTEDMDLEDEYDDDLPAPGKEADGKAVGEMEGEDEEPVADKAVAPGVSAEPE